MTGIRARLAKAQKQPEIPQKPRRIETTRYSPDYQTGLTEQQVQEHRMHGWRNLSVEPPALTDREIVRKNVCTYFNLIFLILAILLILVGSFRSLTFLPVIIINTCIGIFQEIKAKRTLEKLSMLDAQMVTAIRDGKKVKVDSEQLVLDDIVMFKAGAQICADAIVQAGEVQVNESLLTGESDEITKKNGAELMSGSFVVSGQCFARLDKVGEDSYISKLTLEAKATQEGEQSEMIRALDKLVKAAGIAIIPIGIALVIQSFFFNDQSFRSSIVSMVAAVIGMIPEGLYLLATVALAVSTMRLAKQKVLLHDMKSIETLARVNVLCVDKTGTITENNMCVKKVIPTKNCDVKKMPPLEQLIGDFANAMSSDNITMEALKEYFKEGTGKKVEEITSFSSAYKYSGVTYEDCVHVLGAPEFILREDYAIYEEEISGYAKRGYRVLVFGEYKGRLTGKALTAKVIPLGYILLANPIRENAVETFTYFEEQGVEVKVISGDNPMTVAEVAKEAGIANANQYVDASKLTDDKQIEQAILKYTVFGRVTPDQKRKFVKALQKNGKTVAMTGDGVNDVLALKDADCSVAMASGSEAAVQASQVVLLESDFSCMPSVVMEGRRVVNNIQRSATLFLVKNIFSVLLSVFSIIFMYTYPLEPSQISLISMFTIGIPAFFLALEPNKNVIKGRFLTNVIVRALPAAVTDFLAVAMLVIVGNTFGVDYNSVSVAATLLMALVGFLILYRISSPMNPMRITVIVGCVIGLLFCATILSDLFAITDMSKQCVMLFVVFFIATESVLRYLNVFSAWLEKMFVKAKAAWKAGMEAGRE